MIELNDVVVSQLSIDADAEDPALQETIELAFGEFIMTYTPQNPDGTPGTPIIGGWNLGTNSEP